MRGRGAFAHLHYDGCAFNDKPKGGNESWDVKVKEEVEKVEEARSSSDE